MKRFILSFALNLIGICASAQKMVTTDVVKSLNFGAQKLCVLRSDTTEAYSIQIKMAYSSSDVVIGLGNKQKAIHLLSWLYNAKKPSSGDAYVDLENDTHNFAKIGKSTITFCDDLKVRKAQFGKTYIKTFLKALGVDTDGNPLPEADQSEDEESKKSWEE